MVLTAKQRIQAGVFAALALLATSSHALTHPICSDADQTDAYVVNWLEALAEAKCGSNMPKGKMTCDAMSATLNRLKFKMEEHAEKFGTEPLEPDDFGQYCDLLDAVRREMPF